MIDLLIDGIVRAVINAGLDAIHARVQSEIEGALGGQPSLPVSLKPILDSLATMTAQGSELLDVLQRPSETAGIEMRERAVLALSHGWFQEALEDARASIERYPYRSSTQLIGAMAAFNLDDGEQTMIMLAKAVRYSAHGEPEIGAVAALAAAGLATGIQAPNYGIQLLEIANENTGHRCPPVVAALATLTGKEVYRRELLELWWSEWSVTRSEMDAGWNVPIVTIPTVTMAPYSAAGAWFNTATSTITKPIQELQAARTDLRSQLHRLNKALATDPPELASFDKVLRTRFGIKTPQVVTSLRKTLTAIAYFNEPNMPRESMYAGMTAVDLADVRKTLGYIRRSALFARSLIELQLGLGHGPGLELWSALLELEKRPYPSLPYTSDVQINHAAKSLIALGALDNASPTAADSNARKVLAWKDMYVQVLDSIVAETAEDNLQKVSQAKREYLLATNKLKDITPLTLPVVPWVPDLSANKLSSGQSAGGRQATGPQTQESPRTQD